MPVSESESERDEQRRILLARLRRDLRAPIGIIVECCDLLIDDSAEPLSPSFREDMTKIRAAGRRLLTLVDEVFGPSASDAGSLDAEAIGSRLRHELRTPLNHVIGYAEMLLEDAESAGQEAAAGDLEKIRTAGRQLTVMLDQALASLSNTSAPSGNGAPSGSGAGFDVTIEDLTADLERRRAPLNGRVLVVDDDEINRDVLSRRVRSQGAEVTTASSGQEALETLRAEPFDAVLLDVMMPDMNGYEVLREMKADTSLRDIPVVMISALDEVESAVRCIRLGAEDYLAKPFEPTLLRARLRASIEKKQLHDREIVHLRAIDEERRRSEALLHAIFPPQIVRELKANQSVRPRRYENVAVLFSDTVGFTSFAEAREPEEVIDHLQRLVHRQDEIAEVHDLEKIKTIGDAFMAAAGLLRPMSDPVQACVRCGLDMIDAARALDPPFELRIGVHVGPLVGGVLGRKQYLFDLIGDTVNTASRVESAGVHGAVSLSGSAWQQIAHLSMGRSLGIVEVKGREAIEIVRFERFR
ncbi:adenylate/guanylate cyclase domain-containing protein [soil metagenome]